MKPKGTKKQQLSQMSDNESSDEKESESTSLKQLLCQITKYFDTIMGLKDTMQKLTIENIELKHEMGEMKKANDDLLQRVEMLEKASGGWTTASKANHGPVAGAVKTADWNEYSLSDISVELANRASKVKNIIIMGLDETDAQTDKDNITELLRDILEMSVDITDSFRLGKDEGKTRPLMVQTPSAQIRNTVLLNAKKMRLLEPTHKFKKVYLRADMTRLELKEDFDKRNAAKLRYTARNSAIPAKK